MERKKKELASYKIDKETEISGYYQMEKQINVLKDAIKEVVTKPKHLVPFLQAGRLLHVCFVNLCSCFFYNLDSMLNIPTSSNFKLKS